LKKNPIEILKLNSNENFFIPLSFLKKILKEVIDETDPRVYPRDEFSNLKEKLSKYLHADEEGIIIGTGSDQMIELATRIFLRYPNDEVISISPTFSIYERCTKIQRAKYKAISLKEDFSLDIKKIFKSVTKNSKIIFLCSPNNPTANKFNKEDVLNLTENFKGIVVVDEAYIDFTKGSIADQVENYENLIVLRTFSKVFGLAGLRIGSLITNRKLAKIIDTKFQMPYSVSLIALKIAGKILEKIKIINNCLVNLKNERSRLIKLLYQIDTIQAFNSETNFVLFRTEKNSKKICEKLLKKGIIIRNIGKIGLLNNYIRVTVAPPPITNIFLKNLKEILYE
jgi:histidinol-phosphate aminotransferase